jgi:hypothetical protein
MCALSSMYLYSCFAAPTNTPCTPIGYPDGAKLDVESGKIYSFETDDTYSEVVGFYQENLNFDPSLKNKYGPINWRAYPIRDDGVLYVCGAVLDGYTSEIGCIHVVEKYGKGFIDITWSYLVDGPAVSCDVLPEIEPEDYLIGP